MDYDFYYGKHCARYYGWLPAAKKYKAKSRRKSLKYFTLCAEQAIDVFMLESEGVITRDKNRRLANVVICEKDAEVAARIFSLVRPPLQEAILVGPLEQILTFEENEHTRGLSPDDDVRNRHIREMLRIKRLHRRLRDYFPFDIINFDTYGNILNHNKDSNRLLYIAFERIFQLQQPVSSFLFLMTLPISDIDNSFQSRFRNDFDSNVANYPVVRDRLMATVETISYDEIDEDKKISLSIAKSIISAVARAAGWNCEHKGICIYENKNLRKMLSAVVLLSKPKSAPDLSSYLKDVIRIIQSMPLYYSYQEAMKNSDVRTHLEKIKAYREKIMMESQM